MGFWSLEFGAWGLGFSSLGFWSLGFWSLEFGVLEFWGCGIGRGEVAVAVVVSIVASR